MEELRADAAVRAHPFHHLDDIRADFLAEFRDGVDERYLGGEIGIGGIFDDLRALHITDEHLPLQRRIELDEFQRGLRVGCPDDDAIRPQAVGNGISLSQELGVGDYIKVSSFRLVLFKDAAHQIARSHRHGALVDHHLVVIHGFSDGLCGALHMGQITGAIFGRGSVNTDEDYL